MTLIQIKNDTQMFMDFSPKKAKSLFKIEDSWECVKKDNARCYFLWSDYHLMYIVRFTIERSDWKEAKKNSFLLDQILTNESQWFVPFFITEINNRSDRFTINISSSEKKKKNFLFLINQPKKIDWRTICFLFYAEQGHFIFARR
jgi:hypothetical protein